MVDKRTVAFPGSAPNYIDTPSTNLLPADDAHGHQSIGGWTTSGSNTITTAVDTDESLVNPFFTKGGFTKVFKVTYQDNLDLAALTLPTLTAAAHTFITSVWLPSNWDGGDISIDDNGTYVGETGVSNQDASAGTAGSWQDTWRKFTPDAGDLVGTLTIATASTPTAGRVMYFAINTAHAGSTATQVQSLKVTGNLDLRASTAPTSWNSDVVMFSIYQADKSFSIHTRSGGQPGVLLSNDGSAISADRSTATFSGVDGELSLLRFLSTLTVGYEFFQDGTSVKTGGALASTFPATSRLTVGQRGGSKYFDGEIEYVELRDGDDGPICAKMDAQDVYDTFGGGDPGADNTWVGGTDGRTWTIHGSGLVVKNTLEMGPEQLVDIAGLLASSLDTELLGYLVEAGASAVTDVVGALNELNSTTGIGFAEAFNTFITANGGIPKVG